MIKESHASKHKREMINNMRLYRIQLSVLLGIVKTYYLTNIKFYTDQVRLEGREIQETMKTICDTEINIRNHEYIRRQFKKHHPKIAETIKCLYREALWRRYES
jgi:hypothetical protein